MPIMYGIAAFAVLANGLDQTGVDPQIDKQYAIVKNGHSTPPVVPVVATDDVQSSTHSRGGELSVRLDTQDGVAPPASVMTVQGGVATGGVSQGVPAQTVIIQGGATAATAPSIAWGQSVAAVPGQRIATVPSLSLWSGSDNLSRLKGMDRLVSVQFTNASAADVLKWLSKQNVNFVANVDRLPKSKITMNVSHVPLHEALETVAESLGGSWQVKGSTLIFSAGMFHTTSFAPARAGSLRSFNTAPFDGKAFGDMKLFNQMNDKDWKSFQLDQKKMNEDMAKRLKDMNSLYGDGKTFTYKMDPKQMQEFKSLGMMKDGKAFTYKFDPKQMEELKALGMTKDGKTFTMDPKQMEQFKALGMLKDGNTFKWDTKAFGDMKNFGDSKFFKGMAFKKIDVEKFSKSLSKSQRDLMKKQGYLKFSDLTEAQKAMMFDGSVKDLGSDFTFVFSNNGDKITIKK